MIDGGIVGGYYGVQGGGRGGSIGNYQGQFTATTVKQRAFEKHDYIVFDDGTDLEVFLAPQDIPINSPAPKEAGALWGGLDTTITSGVSRADLDAALTHYARSATLASAVDTINTALGNKADITSLNLKLNQSDFNIEKARLESGITGNRNNIEANDTDIGTLMTAIQALQTALSNLPSGGGESSGSTPASGGVSSSDLQTALDELKNLLEAKITANAEKFGGVPLNGPDVSGENLTHARVVNFNQFIPEANWATVPVFNGLNLLRDALPAGVNFRDLGQYDRLLIRITFYLGEIASARRAQSVDFFVNVSEWNSLKTVPLPDQEIAESSTNRIQIIASTKDNRALVHEFPQLPDGAFANTLSTTGNTGGNQVRAFQAAVQKWINDFRASKRLIYVGKSNETNPRLLIGISGTDQDFLAEVRGYH